MQNMYACIIRLGEDFVRVLNCDLEHALWRLCELSGHVADALGHYPVSQGVSKRVLCPASQVGAVPGQENGPSYSRSHDEAKKTRVCPRVCEPGALARRERRLGVARARAWLTPC